MSSGACYSPKIREDLIPDLTGKTISQLDKPFNTKGEIAMEGTTSFELEALLELELDFSFRPGSPGRLTADPSLSIPGQGPEYEIGEIRVYHEKQWHKVPDWLWEILNTRYGKDLIEAVNQWLAETS